MPGSGGFSVAYRLRESNPHLPVIFITASKQAGLRENARQLGAAGFFEKPYDAEKLLAAIRATLGGFIPSSDMPASESPKQEMKSF